MFQRKISAVFKYILLFPELRLEKKFRIVRVHKKSVLLLSLNYNFTTGAAVYPVVIWLVHKYDRKTFKILFPKPVLRIRDKHPGSDFFPSRIPDPHKNLRILTLKIVSKLSEIWSGLFIPDPVQDHGSRIQGSKRHRILDPDPQHCPNPSLFLGHIACVDHIGAYPTAKNSPVKRKRSPSTPILTPPPPTTPPQSI